MRDIDNPNSFPLSPIANAVSLQIKYTKLIGLLPFCIASSVMAVENQQDESVDDSVVVSTHPYPNLKGVGG